MKIVGSWGTLTVDPATGTVLHYDEQDRYGPVPEGYANIVKVNIEEWRLHYPGEEPVSVDILDIGYWLDSGVYEPPANDWREQFRNEHGFITGTEPCPSPSKK